MSDNTANETLFFCTCCGDCCRGYGGTYVSPADIAAIAAYIGVPEAGFVDTYCQMSGSRPVLAQGPDGRCVFWDKLCTIHPVKPGMCRKWPFIESVLVDVGNWRTMADSCPGMNKDAPDAVISARVAAALEAFNTDGRKKPPA